MATRSVFSRIIQLVLFGTAGTLCGLAVAVLLLRQSLGSLDLRVDGILRGEDAGIYGLAAPLLSGGAAIALPFLVLALGLVVFTVALVLALRDSESKGRAVLTAIVGLLVGGVLAAVTLFFADGPTRVMTAMQAADLGTGAILRGVLWPRLVYGSLFGATIGWAVGAALASSWGRRIALFLIVILLAAATGAIVMLTHPPLLDVPANATQLSEGEEGQEVALWIVGGSDRAQRVVLDVSVFFHMNPGETLPAKIDRRNMTRARKAIADYPLLHPRSLVADQLIVAGSMAELDIEGVAEGLLELFDRRGHPADGRRLATLLGRMAPSPRAVKLLQTLTTPHQYRIGPTASHQLCALANASGSKAAAQQLSCSGAATRAEVSQVKGTLTFKGRPLRRVPTGLVVAPTTKEPGWLQKGEVGALALALVAGTKTNIKGEMLFENIPPGSYYLAIAPARNQARANEVKLNALVRIEVPAKAGVVDLGEIQAGGPGKAARAAKRLSKEGAPIDVGSPGTAVPAPTPPVEKAKSDPGTPAPEAATPEKAGDATNAAKVAPRPVQKERPLPGAAKRVITKITPAGRNKVLVPVGFGDDLLDSDRSVISPEATVVPVKNAAGRVRGLELQGIRPNGVEVALGFQEGDIIESVNGRALHSVDDMVDLVDSLRGTNRVMVRVRREKRLLIVRIDIDE